MIKSIITTSQNKPGFSSGLFETRLTASDLQRSITFYKDVIGLEPGLEVPERNCAFLWIGESKRSMLGLWSLGTMPLGLVLNMAFEVPGMIC